MEMDFLRALTVLQAPVVCCDTLCPMVRWGFLCWGHVLLFLGQTVRLQEDADVDCRVYGSSLGKDVSPRLASTVIEQDNAYWEIRVPGAWQGVET